MRGIISGTLVTLVLVVAGCTTDGAETTTNETKIATKAKTINYTAWACEGRKKTVTGYRCTNFHASYGPGRSGAVKEVQRICPGNCKILLVKQGCVPLTLDSRKVLRPKC